MDSVFGMKLFVKELYRLVCERKYSDMIYPANCSKFVNFNLEELFLFQTYLKDLPNVTRRRRACHFVYRRKLICME